MTAVTDEQVAALRAFLAEEYQETELLGRQLFASDGVEGFGELVYAAFVVAVRRRFSPTWSIPDVVGFVATARVRLLRDEIEVDPRAAETLIRRALGDTIATEFEEVARARVQVFLLRELVADEELDGSGLDAFLAEARTLADQLIG